MIRFNDLRAILSDAQSTAALQGYYERGWDRILRTLALGIARPGSQRARLLVAQLRGILATLDPRRDSFVRHWIREWIRRSFVVGEAASMREIQGSPLRVPARQTADIVANVIGTVDAKLAGLVASMDASLGLAIRMTHAALLADPDLRGGLTDGILRTQEGRQIAADLQEVVLGGSNPVTARRLQQSGIPKTVVDALDRLNAGTVTVGKASVNAVAYADAVGQDGITDANNAAALAVTSRNDVDHVYIEREEKLNICRFCFRVQFNVFYAGKEEKDPAGFPRLADLPPGPKWHIKCAHAVVAWPLAQHTTQEIASALANALSIPAEYYGPAGTVEKVNQGPAALQQVRKQA